MVHAALAAVNKNVSMLLLFECLCHVVRDVLLGYSKTRDDLIRSNDEFLHHRQPDIRGRQFVASTLDHSNGDNKDNLVAIGIVGSGQRIQCRSESRRRPSINSE
jgi:hypothetical protein